MRARKTKTVVGPYKTVFPPKNPRPPKVRKPPRDPKAFRPQEEDATYLAELSERGYGTTEALRLALRLARDLEQATGEQYARIAAIAAERGITLGQAIGELIRAALAAQDEAARK